MSLSSEERVRELIRTGAIDATEGERLLRAMNRDVSIGAAHLLINPFERFGGGVACLFGAVISVASVMTAVRLGVHFDGLLDLHVGSACTLQTAVIEQVAAWLVPSLLAFIVARALGSRGRIVDFFGAMGLARLPMLLATIPLGFLLPKDYEPRMSPVTFVIVGTALIALAWNVTLLYQGYKNASGLRSSRLVGSFVGVVVGGEAISKLIVGLV